MKCNGIKTEIGFYMHKNYTRIHACGHVTLNIQSCEGGSQFRPTPDRSFHHSPFRVDSGAFAEGARRRRWTRRRMYLNALPRRQSHKFHWWRLRRWLRRSARCVHSHLAGDDIVGCDDWGEGSLECDMWINVDTTGALAACAMKVVVARVALRVAIRQRRLTQDAVLIRRIDGRRGMKILYPTHREPRGEFRRDDELILCTRHSDIDDIHLRSACSGDATNAQRVHRPVCAGRHSGPALRSRPRPSPSRTSSSTSTPVCAS